MRARSLIQAFIILSLGAFLLSSCLGSALPTPTLISDLEYTQAVETLVAELTQNAPVKSQTPLAAAVSSASPTEQTLPPTSTPVPTETLPPTSTSAPTDTAEPTETSTPSLTDTPTSTPEPAWELVYEDDLKLGNWITDKTDSFRLQYSMGGYMITNRLPNEITYSVRNDPYKDVRLEVAAKRVSGPLDGYYGLICSFVNGSNYYFLGIGVDGWYGIGVKQTGMMRYLKEGNDQNGVILKADETNNLRAECAQGILTLWVNDVQLASVKDNTFSEGAIGVGVGNRQDTGTEVVFSDLKVYEPEDQ
jgi:hypothetical protein